MIKKAKKFLYVIIKFMIEKRCTWCGEDPLYVSYHDNEWGVPVHDDKKHFELLLLEGAQAGLSWITVLRKRGNYRAAFDGFDPEKVAAYTEDKIDSLLQNPGIIRNRLKIKSAIGNASAFLAIQKEYGSFDKYIWQFTDGKTIINKFEYIESIPATSPESDRMSKDLKKHGFKFCGSTICYAYMQSAGMVNDHTTDCFRYYQLLTEMGHC